MLTLFTEFKNIIPVKRYCKNRRAGFCNFDVDFLFNWIQYSRSDVSVTPVDVIYKDLFIYLLWSMHPLNKNNISGGPLPSLEPVWNKEIFSRLGFILYLSSSSNSLDTITVRNIPLYFSRSMWLPLFYFSGIFLEFLTLFNTCNNALKWPVPKWWNISECIP